MATTRPTVRDCDEHDDCAVIESPGFPKTPGSWRSHAPADIDPAERLHPDTPVVNDRRAGASSRATLERAEPSAETTRRLGEL